MAAQLDSLRSQMDKLFGMLEKPGAKDLSAVFQSGREYRNPAIYEKLVESYNIDQYGTNFKSATKLQKESVAHSDNSRRVSSYNSCHQSSSYGQSSSRNKSTNSHSSTSSYQRRKETTKPTLESYKKVWRNADAVCFDVDSTVCCDEAIDELARYVGKSKEVAEITKSAMAGGSDFKTALAKRLGIIQPSTKILDQYLTTNQPKLTPQVKELIALLHSRGVDVYLVSGGFDIIIQAAAEKLNIPYSNIFANTIKFYPDGSYAGFDDTRPTSTQDGKSRVVASLKQARNYKNVVMIGDGVTDLQACPPADAFIGFGGNQVRESVKKNSIWFVYSFNELIAELS